MPARGLRRRSDGSGPWGVRAALPWPRVRLLLALLLVLGACVQGNGSTTGEPTTSDAGTDTAGGDPSQARDVAIPTDGVDLAGTLRLPDGPPPHPGVTIVHGSGPNSRHGSMRGQLGLTLPAAVPVYDELAEGLRARGYAVLTWDKRTCGPFNDCADNGYPTPPDDLTLETLTRDAAAVLDHLAGRDDIGDLVLIGHSQGGTIAAELAGRRDDLDAVILLGTPAVPIHEVLAAQADTLRELVAAAGQQGAAADAAVADIRSLAEEVAAIADGAVDGPDVGGASRDFWLSWIEASRRAPDRIGSGQAPVLALGGEHDWNVAPQQVRAWGPHLGGDSRVEIMPGVTHALTRLDTGDPTAITPRDVGTNVDPAVVGRIASWLDPIVDVKDS